MADNRNSHFVTLINHSFTPEIQWLLFVWQTVVREYEKENAGTGEADLISHKTSYRESSQILEGVRSLVLLWNLADASAAVLSRRLLQFQSNWKTIASSRLCEILRNVFGDIELIPMGLCSQRATITPHDLKPDWNFIVNKKWLPVEQRINVVKSLIKQRGFLTIRIDFPVSNDLKIRIHPNYVYIHRTVCIIHNILISARNILQLNDFECYPVFF